MSEQNKTSNPRPLVRKLNMRFFLRTFFLLLQLDLLLLFSLFGWTLIQFEQDIQQQRSTVQWVGAETLGAENREGVVFPNWLQRILPLQQPEVARKLYWPANLSWEHADFWQQASDVVYRVSFAEQGQIWAIEYRMQEDLQDFAYWFIGLLILEFLLLLRIGSKGARQIRRELQPIYDLAYTARSITSPAATRVVGQLAGQISSIDAQELQLKQRISVADAPNELKPLAQEINALLERISAAYASQVRFVSDASHELRTPIAVIQGYADLLDRWGKTDEKILAESIAAIKSEAYSMKKLVEQLLFLARGDNETFGLNMQLVEVSALAREAVREMQIIDTQHLYTTQLEEELWVEADRDLLKQALRIFLENSMNYSPEGAEILVLAKEEIEEREAEAVRETVDEKVYAMEVAEKSLKQSKIKLSVQDNGIGIAPEELPRIFQRFYRSEASRARKTGGSGLGLAIAELIIDRHGFQLSVLSRQGMGTRTTIIAPKVQTPINSADQ